MKDSISKDIEQSKVYIDNEQEYIRYTEEYAKLLTRTVMTCLKEEGVRVGCEINILLTDDSSIRQINNQFRNIDVPTDVLSFPMAEIANGEINEERIEYDMDEGLLMLGDIVISMETTSKQSEQYGHSFERELAFLAAHGVFHLLGYDHMKKQEETVMMKKQEAVLDKLGIKRA